MPTPLADQHCRDGGAHGLTAAEIAALHPQLPEWEIVTVAGVAQLRRVFTFADFAAALAFTNAVGVMAEAEGHHPALLTEWGRVQVTWWTHSVQGLHLYDFIAAAKTGRIFAGL